MKAIVMRETGGPSVLVLEDSQPTPLRDGEVRLRALASAINHSDLEIRAGNWAIRREPKFPYVPGLEVVGEVTEARNVSGFEPGDRVWTMMQGLGGVRAERDGGYAEYVTVDASVLAPLPKSIDPVAFATVGLAGVTAYEGLRRLGSLEGKRLAVTGAQGGVGSIAALLGQKAGAEVLALERSTPLPAAKSVDAILDVVAGPLFPQLIAALRPGGGYSLVGAIAGGDVRFDAWSLLDQITLTGYSTEQLTGAELRPATKALLDMQLPSVGATVLPLAEAAHAHDQLERRKVKGRVVLVPG